MRQPMRSLTDAFNAHKAGFSQRIDCAVHRATSANYVFWHDHGLLRRVWHNFDRVGLRAYRCNHPCEPRLARYRDMGIRHVVNLRGRQQDAVNAFERESCEALGLHYHNLRIPARSAPPRDLLIELVEGFRKLDGPVLLHCKSGADRTGLAAAIWMLTIEGAPLALAARHLHLRYLHCSFTRSGVLDQVLADFAASGMTDFEAWLHRDYDADATQRRFDTRRQRA